MTTLSDDRKTTYPWVKHLFRAGYGAMLLAHVFATTRSRNDSPRVWYGGARIGNMGGPLVKVKRLREYFPEVRWGYNLVYLLSNTPYLPGVALDLLKRRGIPLVYNQNGVFYKAWYAGDWAAQNRRMARSYHAADWVFYQSEFCRRAADRFLGERAGPGEVLYNAVDTSRFRPRAESREGMRGDYRFLLTGKIDRHLYYRLESSIAGLRIACDGGLDGRLRVAGWIEAETRTRAEDLARSLGLADRVEFTGAYTQEQAPAIYRSADAYVMTKHNDPCPNTVLEALASGLPILYSDSGGVPELASAEAGVALHCPEDWETTQAPTPKAIGDGMLKIAAGHAVFAQAARRRAVDRFDIGHWIDRHRTVFQQLVGLR